MTSFTLHWWAWPASITLSCWNLTPGVHLGSILKKFKKRFGSSIPDLTHLPTSNQPCRTVKSHSTSALTECSPYLPGHSLCTLMCMLRPSPGCVAGRRIKSRDVCP